MQDHATAIKARIRQGETPVVSGSRPVHDQGVNGVDCQQSDCLEDVGDGGRSRIRKARVIHYVREHARDALYVGLDSESVEKKLQNRISGEPEFLLLITLGFQMLVIHESFDLRFESRLGVTIRVGNFRMPDKNREQSVRLRLRHLHGSAVLRPIETPMALHCRTSREL